MILFFRSESKAVIAVKTICEISDAGNASLEWLFSGAKLVQSDKVDGIFIGPRKEMITPWSTTAVEIIQNMNIAGVERVEEFFEVSSEEAEHDKMLQRVYRGLNQETFEIKHAPEPLLYIEDLEKYNESEGLALSPDELDYLESLSKKLDRKLTDSEVFGFSQVNSEHCRHKIFNGKFIIDGVEMESTLFKLIKKTSHQNPNRIVSAYKDNCAFVEGPKIKMFYPKTGDKPDLYVTSEEETVISLKAETHNFPTTVEPFNGAATGSGGEIRDRMAGGTGSFPVAGTAVYMTSYPRFEVEGRDWENNEGREWLYQTPQEILTKASNGASDFGNKFGQALICGSLLTFEYYESWKNWGYDKVIMQAGGIGYAKKSNAIKSSPQTGDKVIVMGGDNYRIGMGGGAVSSVATGEFDNAIEMNAVQRSNPEMQKRVYNAIRSLAEGENNTIVSVHDHGAGGHLNSLSELVEETGGTIEIDKLPIGDPTLSSKEIIGNESQERMGLVMKAADVENLRRIAERERAPMYVVGEATGKHNFTLINNKNGEKAIDLDIKDFFGSTPVTVMEDTSVTEKYDQLEYDIDDIEYYLEQVLQIEAVACKDWLTNKVDRSVSGLIATQQTAGEIQLPLNNLGVTAIGYNDYKGISTSIGHAPAVALIDAEAGSRMAIAESLTNIVWGPLEGGLKGVSLSANWMWPCRNPGEDTRLYNAVKAASDFAIELGINIPTGKDSLSMTQKYPGGERVLAPGTLIVSAAGECSDIRKVVKPVLAKDKKATIIYIPFTYIDETTYELGGSSFAQITGQLGNKTTDIIDATYFVNCFGAVQKMADDGLLLAGHDISAGGLITTLLEMNFANKEGGIDIFLREIDEKDPVRLLFSEASGVVVQVSAKNLEKVMDIADNATIHIYEIGNWNDTGKANITLHKHKLKLDIKEHRDVWFRTSFLFDSRQSGDKLAIERFSNYKSQPLVFDFPYTFEGKLSSYNILQNKGKAAPVAAIIREKGSNGDREMAWALHLAGFSVKDVHMTDLITGRETLEEVRVIAFVGGFSNADTLGSAKGWAGAFLYNEKAKNAIEKFYARKDTLSLGVCNGCQLMAELGLITPENREGSPKMGHNDSHKYESAFVGVEIIDSPSIMLKTLTGSKLGIWVAHGEGKFLFPSDTTGFKTAIKFNYNSYPANPNGSPGAVAGICSTDGRHLAMMPHPERCTYPHNWAHYPAERRDDQVSPWFEIFINAREWIDKNS